jgi:hypothetical protein
VFLIPPERTEYVNSGEIRVFVNVTDQPAAWTAEVKNPDGETSPALNFEVVNPGSQISASVSGTIRDNSGQLLVDAKIVASHVGNVIGSVLTSDGSFHFDNLEAGAYSFTASKTGYENQTQLASVWDSIDLQFRLAKEQPLPTTEKANTLLSAPILPGSEGSSLKVFYNGDWQDLTPASDARKSIKPQLPSIVLTHGWIFPGVTAGIEGWPRTYAQRILNVLNNSGHPVNLLGWEWSKAATGPLPPEQKTIRQGYDLGQALYVALGPTYTERIHFLGHSLGALANAFAANFLHGDQVARDGSILPSVASPTWNYQNTDLTFFDEAEVARFVSPDLLLQDLKRDVIGTTLGGGTPTAALEAGITVALDHASTAIQTRKSPLPVSYEWADNYLSMVGFNYNTPKVVTICLRKSLDITLPSFPSDTISFLAGGLADLNPVSLVLGMIEAHSYSWDWYGQTLTVRNLVAPLHLGFYGSSEYGLVNPFSFPDSALGGTYWEQDHSSPSQLALVRTDPPPPLRLDCNCLGSILKEPGIKRAEFVRAGFADTSDVLGEAYAEAYQSTGELWVNSFNYIETKASQGYTKVVHLGNTVLVRLHLKSPPQAPQPRQPALSASAFQVAGTSAIILPLAIPSRALFIQFDYTVSGDIKDDFLFFGINDESPITFDGKFIPTNSVRTSQPFEVLTLAGKTNRFTFGLSGGTSTDCTVTIQAIRFILDDPTLTIRQENGQPVLSWPADAANWELETADQLPSGEWIPPSAIPTLVDNNYIYRPNSSVRTRFYRLRRE